MKKISSKKNIIIILVVIVFACLLFVLIHHHDKENQVRIPDNYITVFHGGSGEITYSTYIYKIEND